MCNDETNSFSEVSASTSTFQTKKKRKYIDSSDVRFRWISESSADDNTDYINYINSMHDLDDDHRSWLQNKFQVFKKWSGQPPKFNEKLWFERFMKARQNRS